MLFLERLHFRTLRFVLKYFQTQSTGTGVNVSVKPLQQVVQVTGSESPSTLNWNSRTQRPRHEPSRIRLRAIESYLENGHVWVPPSPSHRKTWEEEVNVDTHMLSSKLYGYLLSVICLH